MNTHLFGLTERNLSTLYDIFDKYPEVKEVHIFGSRAKGNYQIGSDIDLAIMNQGVSQRTITHILSDCSESSLPYKVDIVNFSSLQTPELIEHIKRVGILFYQRKQSAIQSNHQHREGATTSDKSL